MRSAASSELGEGSGMVRRTNESTNVRGWNTLVSRTRPSYEEEGEDRGNCIFIDLQVLLHCGIYSMLLTEL